MHIASDRHGYRSYVELFKETSRLILAARNSNNQMQLWENILLLYFFTPSIETKTLVMLKYRI